VSVEAGEERVVYFGDLIPTSAHVDPPWVMGYDLAPAVTVARKQRLLAEMADHGWIAAFEHDPEVTFARIELSGGKFRARPLERGEDGD
jgi:glyoxylase-like metal-dependent hydrolase (beta-lactamase superfamily II)